MIARFKPGKRKCVICGTQFEKDINKVFKNWCSDECAIEVYKKKKPSIEKKILKQEKQKEKAETQKIKEGLKTHPELLSDLQDIFNTFIRLRDKDQPCISCGTMSTSIKYDAGHYYSRKGYSGIRFDEDNVHKQCSNNCNNHLSGNFPEYTIQLPKRIGQERFDALVQRRHVELKLSIPEIKEKIDHYKQKIAELKKL